MIAVAGAMTLSVVWAWLLSEPLSIWRVVTGALTTAVFVAISVVFSTQVIRRDHRFPVDSFVSVGASLAFLLSVPGLQVLLLETLGNGRNSPPRHWDRRYSLLFFGIAAYFALLPVVTRWRLRPSKSPNLELHPSDTGAWLKR